MMNLLESCSEFDGVFCTATREFKKKIQLLRGWIERMTPKEAKEEQEDDDEEEVVKKNATRRV